MAWGEANEPEHGSLGSRRCAACTTQAVAFALDLEALDVAQSTDVEVRTELLSDSFSRESNYGSASFQPVVMQKLRALQQLLLEGKTVFFLDTVHTARPMVHVSYGYAHTRVCICTAAHRLAPYPPRLPPPPLTLLRLRRYRTLWCFAISWTTS